MHATAFRLPLAILAFLGAALFTSNLAQAAAQTATVGQVVTFSVSADGTSPFSYQWYKNSAAISGAKSASYTLSACAASDAGTYYVLVSNLAGSTTSDNAVLTVNTVAIAPVFTTQPVGQIVGAGASVTFIAAASGSPSPTYQWQKNGTNISGATSASYSIASVNTANAGTYTVKATNSSGSATSNGAVLMVRTALAVPARPAYFDAAGYLSRYPDLQAAFGSLPNKEDVAWAHYWNYGVYEGRVFDDAFRVQEYLAFYPDLQAAFGGDLSQATMHWLTTGRSEGRLGRVPADFDVDGYLSRYSDLQAAFGSLSYPQKQVQAFLHYLYTGVYEGRVFDDAFRVQEYLAFYPDLQAVFGSNLSLVAMHWLTTGRTEGRMDRVPADFNVDGYLSRYTDLQAAFRNLPDGQRQVQAFLHYVYTGVYEGRVFDNAFRVHEYLAMYPDLQAAFGSNLSQATLHWLLTGRDEGRLGRYP
jgi:hypothetical protein